MFNYPIAFDHITPGKDQAFPPPDTEFRDFYRQATGIRDVMSTLCIFLVTARGGRRLGEI